MHVEMYKIFKPDFQLLFNTFDLKSNSDITFKLLLDGDGLLRLKKKPVIEIAL